MCGRLSFSLWLLASAVRLYLTYFLMGFQGPTLMLGHRDGNESVPPRSFYLLVLLFLSFPSSILSFTPPLYRPAQWRLGKLNVIGGVVLFFFRFVFCAKLKLFENYPVSSQDLNPVENVPPWKSLLLLHLGRFLFPSWELSLGMCQGQSERACDAKNATPLESRTAD